MANVKAALQIKNTLITQFTSSYTFTVKTESEYTIGLNFVNGTTYDFKACIMLEVGENATDYEPYKEAQTITAQFPETIYGGVLEWNTGVLTVTHNENGNKHEDPYTIQLTPQQIETLKYNNTVWSDCGKTRIEYIADTKTYIDNKFNELSTALLAMGGN